ncbi:hypothetical protein HanPSC8_Chr10g0408971 [Helianthus annuus]|nr:hypothetical protein HanPSC8_Chr10g0408971 [Helianthus annuus]
MDGWDLDIGPWVCSSLTNLQPGRKKDLRRQSCKLPFTRNKKRRLRFIYLFIYLFIYFLHFLVICCNVNIHCKIPKFFIV